MTRAEHLRWAKDRALAELPDLASAFGSMLSDLGKHPELLHHPGKELGVMLNVGGHLNTVAKMKEWIEGFN